MADLSAEQIELLSGQYTRFTKTLSKDQKDRLGELIAFVRTTVGSTTEAEFAGSFTAAEAAQVLAYVHGVLMLIK
ncbi:MAG TPA: hypothetical protein VL738_45045 [Dactylosporangium sp.]|jgi:hypothetical protein|nr:hypothetical protein [Dactylosporangium sp.]